LPARISPKENSGANGKFLPKPLLFHLRHPNSKTNQPKFWQILSPKNSFAKTSSALVPPPARILGGQNTKEKCPFLFRKNWSRANPKSKEHFSLVSAEALRGGGGTVHSSSGLLSKKVRILYNEYRNFSKRASEPKIWSARSAVCSEFPPKNPNSARIRHAPRGSSFANTIL